MRNCVKYYFDFSFSFFPFFSGSGKAERSARCTLQEQEKGGERDGGMKGRRRNGASRAENGR